MTMMTATKSARKSSKSARRNELVVSLALSIDHTVYTVTPIKSECPDVCCAWRLHKRSDGSLYDVADTVRGATCDCGDQTFRHEGQDNVGCKHVQALRLMGLLDVPAPIAFNAPPPSPCCPAGEPAACGACVPTATAEDAPTATPDLFPPGDRLDPWDAESDPALWPDETDADTWELGPDPDAYEPTALDLAELAEENGQAAAREHLDVPTLDLAGLIDHTAEFFAGWPTDAGKLIAETLSDLAQRIRFTSSATPAEYAVRSEQVDLDARESWYAAGYLEGKAACACHDRIPGYPFGHDA